MNFIDEQNVALLQVGEQRRQIAGLGDHRPRGRAKADAEFARDDLRQRGFPQTGGTDEQHVIERLFSFSSRVDEYLQVGAGLALTNELGQLLRPQRGVAHIVGVALGRDDAGRLSHFDNSFKPSRISCAVSAFSPAPREAAAIAAVACG